MGLVLMDKRKVLTKILNITEKNTKKDGIIQFQKEYFNELFRVSKNQIIWGANYFTEYLKPTKGWIFWYKGQRDLTMSDGEMAWTSFGTVTRQFELNRASLIAQNTFHPTEKPYKLYKWLLDKYAKQGDKILDTHLGSGSSNSLSRLWL
jgi:site-specific DNA-methyltransferase (adenine-specific)